MSAVSPQSTIPGSQALLILDLDETLIYGAESELERPADFRVGPFSVYQRPHLGTFLDSVCRSYSLAIWSSATVDYVDKIAEKIISPQIAWQFVWGRDRCTPRTNFERSEIEYIKDLKKVKRLGYDVNRILFVDDTAAKLSRNFGIAIYVAPYVGQVDDNELPLLAKYLESIREVGDYRALEKRGWRSRVANAQP